MKPLIVLLIVFLLSILTIKLLMKRYDVLLSARIGMSAMLVFTAVGHFAFSKGMALMIPPFVPFKIEIIGLTGILEILLAIGLLIPNLKVSAAWILITFFILILPANISAAVRHIDFQKASLNGTGVTYLWFRIPLQLLFIAWVYLSCIKLW
jgi:uncharacterized membrane protein